MTDEVARPPETPEREQHMQEPSGSRSARQVTVIVPAFNEAEALQSTLPPVLEHTHFGPAS